MSVVSSGRPWAVLHTAWTMFPRSKRPVQKASWRRMERYEKSPAQTAISPHTATAGQRERHSGRATQAVRGSGRGTGGADVTGAAAARSGPPRR